VQLINNEQYPGAREQLTAARAMCEEGKKSEILPAISFHMGVVDEALGDVAAAVEVCLEIFF
jgi:hypothetical protein